MKTPPLTPNQLARRQDAAATESMPEVVRAGLAATRLHITMPSAGGRIEDELLPHLARRTESREISLPEGSFVGSLVKETRLHERGSLLEPVSSPKPHAPAWMAVSHCVRPSGVDRILLRRKNGRIVIPTDSGRVYGEYPARLPF